MGEKALRGDILQKILKFEDAKTLIGLQRVNKDFHQSANIMLARDIFAKMFPELVDANIRNDVRKWEIIQAIDDPTVNTSIFISRKTEQNDWKRYVVPKE